jgi:hypothetical protein
MMDSSKPEKARNQRKNIEKKEKDIHPSTAEITAKEPSLIR